MFEWQTKEYIDKVENGSDPGLQEYMQAEFDFIKKVKDSGAKTFIDVGAGYGRIIPLLSSMAKQVIAIENDTNLLGELQRRAQSLPNVTALKGSGDDLTKILDHPIQKPVVLSMQNTLGPWKGDRERAIAELRTLSERNSGELIISLFCREAIDDWGIPMYASVRDLLGTYEPSKSNLANGIYRTSTGYESYWFSREERESMKKTLGGTLANEVTDHKYHIFHISYF